MRYSGYTGHVEAEALVLIIEGCCEKNIPRYSEEKYN
jgi:hypothetical protein